MNLWKTHEKSQLPNYIELLLLEHAQTYRHRLPLEKPGAKEEHQDTMRTR